jgi:hypothetical protein
MNPVPQRLTMWSNISRMIRSGFRKAIYTEVITFLSLFALFNSGISKGIRGRQLLLLILSYL